ncbi:integrin alpha-6-like [Conger conger]|uniref:integrin alpha-6-like n=1 Tax=Conger conger TaxID=82655 RepID=UPI002A5A210B|nr:integrin alpha-6-like [Conger conger]
MAFCEGTLVLLLFLFLSERTHISAFNLDTENVIRKDGDRESLFGFSLAMHRQVKPVDKRILLIGAPRAKALPRQKADVTGGLYSCEVTTQSNDCKRVDFDNDADLSIENKENQWMGVTVHSQGPGGKVVTCAHRYQRLLFVNTPQESRDITGRCYVLSEDLRIDPLLEEEGGNWKFCDGRTRGHEMFGSCQQGLSATFTKDYHYVVFGAPGAYNWKGIVRAEQKNSTLLEQDIFDDGPYEVGGENRLDPNLVPVPANSYLGFSLDTGKSITKKGVLIIVAGAPRANHSGAVVFLKKEADLSTMLSPEHTLEGEGLASSFGYDLAVVDLNGDGWQDLAVGAPQYFMKDGEVGGAVYIYINKGGKWDTVKPIRLNGTKDSMFGLAVENIGDINQDSYEDIAVGAPYDGAGAGKVYIYHGTADGINTMPAQVLEGDSDIKLFGYSLAGNMDLDRNSYPDLAIGSLSDAVFLYRAKPVINIQKSVKILPKEIDLTKTSSLSVEACFAYTANPSSYSPRLTLEYSFEAESERRKLGLPSRVTFHKKSSTDQDYQSTGTLELNGQNTQKCVKTELKLQDRIKDKLRGIPIEVSVAILKAKRRKRALPELVPILNSNQPSKTTAEVNFLKEGCGTDNICQSKLELQYKFCSREPNQDVFHPLLVTDGVPKISLSDQKDIALEITVKNYGGDDAHEAKLIVMIPDALSYAAFRSPTPTLTCAANKNGSQAECELGNPLKSDSEVTFHIILGTAGISLNTKEIELNLQLETTSEQKNLVPVKARAIVVIELLLSVSGVARPSQVYFGGEVKGERAMKTEDEIGSLIEYEFRIINLGKPLKSFGRAALNIHWPKENSAEKWILYLVKINTSGLDEIPCSPEREIGPLSHIKESSATRRKREVERKSSDEGKISLLTDKRKYKTLTCDEAKCVQIKCPLQGMDSNAVILLRARLWNATFIEDYAKLNYLDIIVKASLSLDASTNNMVLRDTETQVRVTVFPEKSAAQQSGVPWWIILVAILAGILMLALLVFLLWKCGFFKRDKKNKYDASYHKAEIHVQPSDKERLTADA